MRSGDVALGIETGITALLTFSAAMIALTAMMRWLRFAAFTPFVVYRMIVGGIILFWIYA